MHIVRRQNNCPAAFCTLPEQTHEVLPAILAYVLRFHKPQAPSFNALSTPGVACPKHYRNIICLPPTYRLPFRYTRLAEGDCHMLERQEPAAPCALEG